MIRGQVTTDGVPKVLLSVAGKEFTAIVDTGFNGDLELPLTLRDLLDAQFVARSRSLLAAGQTVEEDVYSVEFPFDGRTMEAYATFVSANEILIGTNLLQEHRLEIDFKTRVLFLTRNDRQVVPRDDEWTGVN